MHGRTDYFPSTVYFLHTAELAGINAFAIRGSVFLVKRSPANVTASPHQKIGKFTGGLVGRGQFPLGDRCLHFVAPKKEGTLGVGIDHAVIVGDVPVRREQLAVNICVKGFAFRFNDLPDSDFIGLGNGGAKARREEEEGENDCFHY